MLSSISIKDERQQQAQGFNKVHPIELYLGGMVGNMGVNFNPQALATNTGYFTMFFDSQDMQQTWIKQLQRATECYDVGEFYNFKQSKKDQKSQEIQQKVFEAESPNKRDQISPPARREESPGASDNELKAGEEHMVFDGTDLHLKGSQAYTKVIAKARSGCTIVMGTHKKSGKQVAIKIIAKKNLATSQVEEIRDTIKMYEICTHLNVVKLEDYFESKEEFHLCLELHSDQTLEGFVNQHIEILEEARVRDIVGKIGNAIEYLHSIGVILRNLDCKGILMTETAEGMSLESAVPRICRLNKAVQMGYEQRTSDIFGDVEFRSPEQVQGKPYSFKSDAWTFGVILFFCLTGRMPFEGATDHDKRRSSTELICSANGYTILEENIIYTEPKLGLILSRGHSKQGVDLVSKLLEKDPVSRISVSAALKHQWFKLNFDAANRSLEQIATEGNQLAHLKKRMSSFRKKRSGSIHDEQGASQAQRTVGKKRSKLIVFD